MSSKASCCARRGLELLELGADGDATGVSALGRVLGLLPLQGEVLARFADLVGDIGIALVHDREERTLLRGVADVARVQDDEHRVAKGVHVAVDGEPGERGAQAFDRGACINDALVGDGRVPVRLVKGALGGLELRLRSHDVRIDRVERGFDLLVAGLEGVDLRRDQRALLTHLLALSLLVVDAVAIGFRRHRGETDSEGDDDR